MEKSQYQIEAETLLQNMGIKFAAAFLYHGPHFEDEKEYRNVWQLTLTRGRDVISVKFGQSINEFFIFEKSRETGRLTKRLRPIKIIPNAFDLLTCLTKNDPGSFSNFCAEFGFDTDSRKAEKTYLAVREEWEQVSRFFTVDEIEKIQEVQ